ncbi:MULTISPECIES: HAD family hydrolase [unclassified Sphingomonas]|uniref:HAD family hydrolase n=1 Tax=unclassified Sphingomonas TaxID=196159 RepID=UPI0006F2B23E|nr:MULTISPECIES: HAD family hydrolase [unclassified Sphingomonas]KQX25351.1 haloacid dehalogenase [Sphingomonas sp. Root1294]KQY66344.1 haloacid dehalogenase [Sphingomonas sp. Root50]KRB90344.1 haloacid dehalogenase [Sphingomonas sp. Root720]
MTELAIYDMDRTITRTGTFTPFMIHAALRLAPWRLVFVPFAAMVMLAYVAKLIERKRVKELNQAMLIGRRIPAATLIPIAESFAEKVMRHNILPGALDSLAENRAAGRRLVLATASSRIWVEPIAAKLGMDDVVATGAIRGIDDYVSHKVDGENCYGPAKLRMIEAWMGLEKLDRSQCHIRFYSDHVSDVPVLAWADEAIAANPHAGLRAEAKRRNWTIVDWK